MKRLILVCHTDFLRDAPMMADEDRPLSAVGRREATIMARRFSTLGIIPDLCVSSPALRCVQTAEIYAKKLRISPETILTQERIYEAERADILRVVHALDDTADTVAIFGHHPGLTQLLHHLADSDVDKMQMGAFAVLELSAESWKTLSFKRGVLTDYDEPDKKEARHGLWWSLVFWWRQKIQKVELFMIFLIGLLLILGVVFLIVHSGSNISAEPQRTSPRYID